MTTSLNTSGLCKAIRDHLRVVFKDIQLPSEGLGERVPPTIFNSYLPPKRTSRKDVDTDFPFIIVRPSSGDSSRDGSLATIRMILGVRKNEAGVEALFLMLDTIRRAIFERDNLGVFTFEHKFKWVLFDDQQEPFYEMFIDTEWSMFHPQLEGDGHVYE